MALNNIRIVDVGGHNVVPTITCQTEAATTNIKAGELVKFKALGSQYVIPLADGDGVIGTMVPIVGLAATTSTETATVNGTVDVYLPLTGVVYEASAKSAASADTQTEINALVNDRAIIDLTGVVYTIDATGTDVATAPFVIVGGDPARSTLKFVIRAGATHLGDQDLS